MMQTRPAFHTDTALAEGLKELFKQLEERLQLKEPVTAYLAGGMAVHLYTASRVTHDVDAEFSKRIIIPTDLLVEIEQENGAPQLVHFDTNYNSSFALVHEDYLEDSIPVDIGVGQLRLNVFSPVDLAVSKISRFNDNDRQDIAELVRHGLTTADEIEQRATSAMDYYVGNKGPLILNLRDALVLARGAEHAYNQSGATPPVVAQTTKAEGVAASDQVRSAAEIQAYANSEQCKEVMQVAVDALQSKGYPVSDEFIASIRAAVIRDYANGCEVIASKEHQSGTAAHGTDAAGTGVTKAGETPQPGTER